MNNPNSRDQNQPQGVFVYPPGYYPPSNRPEDLSQNLYYAERWQAEKDARAKSVEKYRANPMSWRGWLFAFAFWIVVAFIVMLFTM